MVAAAVAAAEAEAAAAPARAARRARGARAEAAATQAAAAATAAAPARAAKAAGAAQAAGLAGTARSCRSEDRNCRGTRKFSDRCASSRRDSGREKGGSRSSRAMTEIEGRRTRRVQRRVSRSPNPSHRRQAQAAAQTGPALLIAPNLLPAPIRAKAHKIHPNQTHSLNSDG